MNKNEQFVDSFKLLRKRANTILETKSHSSQLPISESDILKLFHELEVHQIELELQNEELKQLKAREAELATEKYVALYDFAPSGYFTISSEGEILQLNLSGAEMLGKDRSHLKNRLFSSFISTDTLVIFSEFLTNVFAGKHKQTCEISLKSNENSARRFHLSGIIDENGDYCFITMLDITDRKQAEIKLREQEIQYRNLANSGLSLIWTSDTDKLCTYFNSTWLKFTGRTLEQEIGNGWAEGVHPDDFDRCMETYVTAFDKREPFQMEYRLRHASGKYRWILDMGTPNYNSSGEFIGYIGNCFDITDRKHSEAMLTNIIEKNPISIQIVDNEGHTLHGNPAYYKLFGAIPPPDFSIFDDLQNKSKEFEQLIALAKGGEIVNLPDIYFNPHDEVSEAPDIPLWIRALIFPLKDSNGKPERFVFMHENITESKLAEQELIMAKELAEESDRLKSAFLANMSHEIRTPMNGILGFAELLKEADLTSEQQQDYLSIIEKSGVRMLNIINNIVDISKIESGQMNVAISETNVNELIENLYLFFKSECEGKGLQISFRNTLPSKESIINSDREKIYAILTNLVKNAVKFTKTGGIEFGYEKFEDYLRFFVKDTGMGIHPDHLKMVFERFRQENELLNRDYEGSGLGLSISKAYVEMLGGKIWVESKVQSSSEINEGGSTFYFTLPYSTPTVSNSLNISTDSQEIKPATIRKLKILIAEDDEGSELYLTAVLSMFCSEILVTKTGVDAVEICRNNPDIDLILMDIKMIEMDGYQATSRIRQFNKDVIIIAQTAFAQNGTRELAIESGCNDYLSKPIHRNELFKILHQYFEK